MLRRVFLFKMKGICIQKKTSATKVKQKAVIDYSSIAFVIYTLHHQRHYSQCLKPRARLEHFQSPNAKTHRETKWKSVRKSVRARENTQKMSHLSALIVFDSMANEIDYRVLDEMQARH